MKGYMDKITLEQYQHLLKVAQKLTAQHDIARLCEIILEEARALTHADGGTLYLLEGYGQQARLEFTIVRNHSLNIRLGGTSGGQIDFPAVPLYQQGQANHHHVASHAALSGELINIGDVYREQGYDFSGTQQFDQKLNYHTQSVLTLPLQSSQGELVGVLQLLNAKDKSGNITPFSTELTPVVMALSGFAAIAILQQQALHDQKELLVKLAGEPNTNRLLERIVSEAQAITRADGGTLYLLRQVNGKAQLEFTLVKNNSLKINLNRRAELSGFAALPLYDQQGNENHHNIATHAALSKRLVNVENAYSNEDFDFSGTHQFDKDNHYRTVSVLAIPLLNHTNEVIGVLQLVNAKHINGQHIVPFSEYSEPLVKALASYAAIALNNLLLVEELKHLLDAFIKVIAKAIDAKSPHTSGHCQRVPVLTELIAQAACDDDQAFASFHFDDDEWYELHVAAWLHDCGKLATPNSVLDKSTKLHCLHDRIHEIEARFASLRTQLENDYWRARVSMLHDDSGLEEMALSAQHQSAQAELDADLRFLQQANKGGEFMDAASQARVRSIGQKRWRNHLGEPVPLLSDDEIYNLCIERGTLNKEERDIINNHMQVTIDMLESLPFPRKLQRVPEYAGGHHERMDGKGFPRGLTREQLSIPARMMAIADIFEALTAKDRPYKAPMKISQALKIMQGMRDNQHIDPDLYDLFLRQRVWETYAKQVLAAEQLDITDTTPYR